MNLDKIVVPDSEKVIYIVQKALMVKSKVFSLLQGKNSLEQSIVIDAPEEIFNVLKVMLIFIYFFILFMYLLNTNY